MVTLKINILKDKLEFIFVFAGFILIDYFHEILLGLGFVIVIHQSEELRENIKSISNRKNIYFFKIPFCFNMY